MKEALQAAETAYSAGQVGDISPLGILRVRRAVEIHLSGRSSPCGSPDDYASHFPAAGRCSANNGHFSGLVAFESSFGVNARVLSSACCTPGRYSRCNHEKLSSPSSAILPRETHENRYFVT